MELRPLAKKVFAPPLRRALRDLATEWRIQQLHRTSCRRAVSLAAHPPLRLNLAAGSHARPGWVNIDPFAPGADLHLDLRRPLPFRDDSVSDIYMEHFFEHLSYPNLSESSGWDHDVEGRPS